MGTATEGKDGGNRMVQLSIAHAIKQYLEHSTARSKPTIGHICKSDILFVVRERGGITFSPSAWAFLFHIIKHHTSHLAKNITTHDVRYLCAFYITTQTYRHERFSRSTSMMNGTIWIGSSSYFVNGMERTIVNDHEDLTDDLSLYLLNDTRRPLYLLSLGTTYSQREKNQKHLVNTYIISCLRPLTSLESVILICFITLTAVSYLESWLTWRSFQPKKS